MAQWYVKDLSKLTDVSVQTLHHYDHIGLLVPSVRQANGYRLYSEKDLLKLQQIIALKFFGFELTQIKNFLSSEIDMLDHFANQSQFLEEKANLLFEASKALKKIVSECSRDKSISWETIIKLIEVYRMTQQLEKTWAGKIFTSEELKEYANFLQENSARFTDQERQAISQRWKDIVIEVNASLDKDPTSDFGIALGKRCMEWVNHFYGKKYAKLRNIIWDEGLKKNQIDHENTLSPKSFAWLEKAISTYHRDRISKILNQVETLPHAVLVKQWEELLIDIHGNDEAHNKEIYKKLMDDKNIKQSAKDWLRKYFGC